MKLVWALILLALLTGVFIFAFRAEGQSGIVTVVDGLQAEPGGWHGSDDVGFPAPSLVFTLGDIRGLRDIQGGNANYGERWNALDIGAGGHVNGVDTPGRLGIGADVTGTIVFHAKGPGHAPIPLATMTPQGTVFHAPVTFESIIKVPGLRKMVRQLLRQHLERRH